MQTEQLAQTAPIAQGESWAPPPARDERFSRGKEERAREKAARKSHRPSKALVSAVIGLALIAAAIAALADLGATQWWVPVAGVAVIVLGLGIVVAGLAGKSSSVLSPLAILTLGATLIASLGWITTGQLVGEITWTPSAVSQDIDQGRVVGVGSLTADLRDVPLDTSVTEIPLRFGVGDVEVIVPDNRRVVVETTVSVGGISIESASNSQGGIPMVGSGTFVLGEEFSEDETLTVSVMGLVGDVSVTTAAPTTMEVTNE